MTVWPWYMLQTSTLLSLPCMVPFFPFLKTLCYWAAKLWVRLPRPSVAPLERSTLSPMTCSHLALLSSVGMGARVSQWWEGSPPTNVAQVRILASTPDVGWVCCWFSPLLQEVFFRVLQFSPLLKNQHFEIPNWTGTHRRVSMSSHEPLSAPWVNKLQNYI